MSTYDTVFLNSKFRNEVASCGLVSPQAMRKNGFQTNDIFGGQFRVEMDDQNRLCVDGFKSDTLSRIIRLTIISDKKFDNNPNDVPLLLEFELGVVKGVCMTLALKSSGFVTRRDDNVGI